MLLASLQFTCFLMNEIKAAPSPSLSHYKKASTTPLLPISVSIMSSSFWTIIFLFTLTITNTSAHHHKPSAVVIGTVYCDTCFRLRSHQNLPKPTQYLLPGASVEVQCKDTGSRTRFRQQAKTDIRGEFEVRLPFHLSRRIRGCSVRLISSNRPYCGVSASAAVSSTLRLKSRKDGTRVFSAGFFTFRPLRQPDVCDQKPTTVDKSKSLSQISDPAFLPPVQDPPSFVSFLPPLPRLPPLPQLPRLPPLPGLPKLSENQPNPFPFLPPNPFNLPVTLPPILPPLFPIPNSPPLLNLPPIPGLIQSPPLQLPPFPFRPTPGFPGVPAAVASEKKSP